MLRSPGTIRSTLRALPAPSGRPTRHISRFLPSQPTQFTSRLCTSSLQRPQLHSALALQRLSASPHVRQATSITPVDKIDFKHEQEIGHQKLPYDPAHVTSSSSTHPILSEIGVPNPEPEPDMGAGIRADIKTIRETFDLSEVPREAYVLGFAGLIPYVATSAATLGCAAEINIAHETGMGNLMTLHTAEQVLHILEPLQVGFGAVIISFLGAIHWGLEWANFGGHVGYPRYAIGVMAPAIAWPTILLPLEYALITQFLAFSMLYYADARACRRGWTPQWYGTYRFVLTFVVGAAIVGSLIGRAEVGEKVARPQGTLDRVKALREGMPDQLAMEEEARRARHAREKEAAEAEDEDDEE